MSAEALIALTVASPVLFSPPNEPSDAASVASVNEKRRPGYFACARAAALTRFCTSAADCPLSMSKSTPIMCGEA
nr:hypothetical protein [Curtobacterium sp. MCLR17_043]